MENTDLFIREGHGGSSNFHKMVRSDRVVSRTYRLNKAIADEISQGAIRLKISTNDFACWLLSQALEQFQAGLIKPQIESVLRRIKNPK